MNKYLQGAAFGLSCGLVQNPLILFKSEFLVILRDEEASLSYNLKQLPRKDKKMFQRKKI